MALKRILFCALKCALGVSFTLLAGLDSRAGVSLRDRGPETTYFSSGGKQYQLIEFKNADRQIVRQVFLGKDFYQIAVGRNGNGYMDSWERYTENMSIRLRGPVRGHFEFMDVEVKQPKGVVLMKFSRIGNGSYALYASSMRPYGQFADSGTNDFIVGCREREKDLQLLAAQMNDVLYNSPSEASDFRKAIEEQILGKSCKRGEYAPVTKDIINAIYDVAASDKGFQGRDATTLESLPKPATKGLYLQCLRYYGLDTHASRIGAGFAQFTSRNSQDSFKWKVSCNPRATDLGDFVERPGKPPRINLGRPSLQMLSGVVGNKSDYRAAYTETFFHEMLHYSLIGDEDTTGDIEHCCSSDNNENGPSCKRVEAIVKLQSRAQVIEKQVVDNMKGDYPLYRNTLRNVFGAIADQTIDDFYSEVAAAYNAETDKPRCKASSGDGLNDECQSEFKSKFSEIVDREFGSDNNGNCVRKATLKMGTQKAKQICAKLQYASDRIFDLNAKQFSSNNPCLNRNKATASLLLPYAWADDFGSDQANDFQPDSEAICQLAEKAKGYKYNFQSPYDAPVTPVPRARPPPVAESTDAYNETESTATADPKAGPTKRWDNSSSGPQVPHYSDLPSEREARILADLNRQNSVSSHLEAMANQLSDQFFPKAAAQSVTSAEPVTAQSSRQAADLISGPGSSSPASSLASSLATSARQTSGIVADPLPKPFESSTEPAGIRPLAAVNGATSQAAANARGLQAAQASSGAPASASSAGADSSPVKTASNFGVGGLTATANAIGNSTSDGNAGATKSRAEEQALKALLVFLQRPFIEVRPELEKRSVIESMTQHAVQVIDDQNNAIGAGYPKIKLVYDQALDRLVIEKKRRAKQ